MLDASSSLVPELLARIPAGTRVRLPDGQHATVTRSTLAEVDVIQPERLIGRGPWTFERWQVEEVR